MSARSLGDRFAAFAAGPEYVVWRDAACRERALAVQYAAVRRLIAESTPEFGEYAAKVAWTLMAEYAAARVHQERALAALRAAEVFQECLAFLRANRMADMSIFFAHAPELRLMLF